MKLENLNAVADRYIHLPYIFEYFSEQVEPKNIAENKICAVLHIHFANAKLKSPIMSRVSNDFLFISTLFLTLAKASVALNSNNQKPTTTTTIANDK